MKSLWLLNSSVTNLTCDSERKEMLDYFEKSSECQLSINERTFEFALNFYVTFSLCLVGILLNATNFKIFCKEHFDGPAYAYMAGISIVDALFLFFQMISALTYLQCDEKILSLCSNQGFRTLQKLSSYMTIYFAMTAVNALQTVSAWLTVLLGIERYMAMKYFHFRRTRCHKTDAKLTIVMIVIIGLVFNLPNSFVLRIHVENPNNSAEHNMTALRFIYTSFGKSNGYLVFSFIRWIGSTILPCVVLVINNICLLILVMRHNRKNVASKQRYLLVKKTSKVLQASIRRIRAQKKLTMLLIIVIFVFLFGQIPRSLLFKDIFAFIYSGCPCGSKYLWVCCPVFKIIRAIFEANYLLSLTVNFFIYVGLNKHFRAHVVSDFIPVCLIRVFGGPKWLRKGAEIHNNNNNICDDSPATNVRTPIIAVTHSIRGSPPPSRRHSCVAFDTNSCILNGHKVLSPSNSSTRVYPRAGYSQASTPTVSSSKTLFRSDDTFGPPREEMDDLLCTTVMITKL